ncbi:MAG: hypothetical protein J6J81_04160, partial [Oscillospiraceae bacterium]|nr:hypothetical protein [Oscillospiraceae bacterium]
MVYRYYIDVELGSRSVNADPIYAAKVIYRELQDAVADVVISRRLRTDGLKVARLEKPADAGKH